MPEPTQDPEVAQVLSAIRQLIEQSRAPSRLPPLLLTPELRVGAATSDPVPAPQGPAPAGALDPKATNSPSVGSVDAGKTGPVQDLTSQPLSLQALRSHAAGELLVLERPVMPGSAAPSRAPETPLPLLILDAPVATQGSDQPSDTGQSDTGQSDTGQSDADSSRSGPLFPDGPAISQPSPETFLPLPESQDAAPSAETVDSALSQEGRDRPSSEDLPADQDSEEASSAPVIAMDPEGNRLHPLPPSSDPAVQDAPQAEANAEPDAQAEDATSAFPSGTTQSATPQVPVPDLPDLSAFLPLAGLPPSIALLDRRRPEPSPQPETVAESVSAEEVPDLVLSEPEEPARHPEPDQPEPEQPEPDQPEPDQPETDLPEADWTEADWPELRADPDRPDPAALPEDDMTSLLPADNATNLPETGDTAASDGGLRDRVVGIVREEVRRELADLRQVVRQEVRDVLAERDRT